MDHDAIILGGGAAGLFCAAVAGQRGRRVLVLEKADAVGKKILISGGGRCNFTNLGAGPENYLSANRHFAKSALARYTPRDFLDLVERHGIAWHEKTLGQLFCDGSARQIVAMLLAECEKGGVEIRTGQEIGRIARDDAGFSVEANGETHRAPALVIATGGPSIPKMGATGFAYDLARQFGLKVVEPRPALVPLTLGGEDVLFRELSGVSAPVEATAGQGKTAAKFREAALLTHKGLSGPAILQASSYWRHGEVLRIDFLPDLAPGWLSERKAKTPQTSMAQVLRAGRAAGPHRPAPGPLRQGAGSGGGAAARVAIPPQRHRGLRQGRGDRRRHLHRRAFLADDGGQEGPRPVRDRRGGRRDRVAWRL